MQITHGFNFHCSTFIVVKKFFYATTDSFGSFNQLIIIPCIGDGES